jgi:hypothetical protein
MGEEMETDSVESELLTDPSVKRGQLHPPVRTLYVEELENTIAPGRTQPQKEVI